MMTEQIKRVTVSVLLCAVSLTVQGIQDRDGRKQERDDRLAKLSARVAAVWPEYKAAVKLYYSGRLKEADEQCNRAINLLEEVDLRAALDAHLMKAQIETDLGFAHSATERLQRILDVRKKDGRAAHVLAYAYIRLRQPAKAVPLLELAFAQLKDQLVFGAPGNDLVPLLSGNAKSLEALALFLRSHDAEGLAGMEASLPDLSGAVNLAPDNSFLRLRYGRALRQLRRWPEARVQLEKAAGIGTASGAQARKMLKQGPLPPLKTGSNP